ncbi:STAS domain-containing protein [Rhodobacter ferrooxidans]|uniref:Anti-sigma factor antagonist n=1 Tax=Rhodobacter ferrooxidans TaxID=371731 RepID=C8RXD6_9RHOB|nr:STAS domain-containing protein [Rhodobacter sp. SW2]EEW26661.1 anti-sigma-factor antagonist [Rhodobacter sp. SW2]
MDLKAEQRGDLLIVTAMGDRIDAAGAIQFKDRMREITEAPTRRVLLDLSRVSFLDSSGLGAVVAVMKALGPDRKLELAGLTPTVQKVFRLTRMDSVFTIHPAVPDRGQPGLRDAG